MMKVSSVPITTSGATPKPHSAPPTSSLLDSSDSKLIGLVSSLSTKDTELSYSGLLRSVSAETGELVKSMALNAERTSLILLMQNVITGYVMAKEGRTNYKGKGHYDLAYIQNSTHITSHRKQDIQAIDAILKEAEAKELPPVSLASALFRYLNQIKTGVNFLWLVRIGNSSDLRTHIHTGLKGFDPILYWVCFIDQVDDYKSYQAQKPDSTKLRLARSMEAEISKVTVSFEKYQILRIALTNSKRQAAEWESKHADLEEENTALSTLNTQKDTRIFELETLVGIPITTVSAKTGPATESRTHGDESVTRREAPKMTGVSSAS